MKKFPFLTPESSIIVLRISIALIFLAHAIVRVANGTISRFADFLTGKGFPLSLYVVWLLTIFEICGGILFAAGYFTRWLSAGFIFILLTGIILIHAERGWFVGEHGAGGIEYSFILIIALLVVSACTTRKNKKGG